DVCSSDLLQDGVINLVELPLADRAGRLQLLDRPRPQRGPAHAHPSGDRAARHEHRLAAGALELRELVADASEHVEPRIAALVDDDARAELDHQASHAARGYGGAPAPP